MLDIDTANKLVMVVDDEELNLKIVQSMLEVENLPTILLKDPYKVLETAKEKKPDVILLDVTMPGKDGFEICKELKADPETTSISVLFLSGQNSSEFIIKGLESGAQDYITKPFNAPELLARVKTHIKLKVMYSRLVEFEKVKALNATMVSQNHTLNQLITSVLGNIDTLDILMESEKVSDKFTGILRSIEKAMLDMDKTLKKFYNIKKVAYTRYSNKTDMLDIDRSSTEEE